MKNILFLKEGTQYNIGQEYMEQIEEICNHMGYSTIILDFKKHCFEQQMNEVLQKTNINLIVTCNAQLLENSLIRERIPWKCTFLLDHPAYYANKLQYADAHTIVFVSDKKHKQYIRTYMKNIKYMEVLPVAGNFIADQKKIVDRTRDVVFCENYQNLEKQKQKLFKKYIGGLRPFVTYMIEMVEQKPVYTLEEILKNTWKHFQVSPTEQEFHNLMYTFQDIDQYQRMYVTDRVIQQLINGDIHVHVFGKGWEEFQADKKENLVIEPGLPYLVWKGVADAKLSLHITPRSKAEFQENLATAMLSGAAVLTDSTDDMEQCFSDGKTMCLYSMERVEELPQKVQTLLQDVDRLQKIADVAQSFAKENFTINHCVEHIFSYIHSVTEDFLSCGEEGKRTAIYLTQPEQEQNVRIDVLQEIQEQETLLKVLMRDFEMKKSDISYLQKKMFQILMDVKHQLPDAEIGNAMVDLIFSDGEPELVGELMLSECRSIQAQLLVKECAYLQKNVKDRSNEMLALQGQISFFRQEYLKNLNVLIQRMSQKYGNDPSSEKQEVLKRIREKRRVDVFNYDWTDSYLQRPAESFAEVVFDETVGMYYVLLNGKRVYYPKNCKREQVLNSFRAISMEQDEKSPHRYLDATFQVEQGDIVIDAGVAEGNFAVEVIDKVQKIYLVECEHQWVEALEQTFKPYKDKVVIIEKMLGNKTDEKSIRIDDFVGDDRINFIKMDVEGAEEDSLKGAEQTLKKNENIRCAICSYHLHDAEKNIKSILLENGFETTTTHGYMFFPYDMDSFVRADLRRGIVRGVKKEH